MKTHRYYGVRTPRLLHMVLAIHLLLGALVTAVVTPAQPAHAVGSLYGVNLEYVQDWRPGLMFTDLIKQSRGWDLPGYTGRAPVDANGWPTSDAQTIMVIGNASWGLGGTYKLSFNGQATISPAADPFTVANQAYNTTTNLTTADIVVPSTAGSLWLKLTNTKRTASSATNTGVTNVKFIRPGYAADGSQVFSNEYLNAVSKFQAFRTMNAVNTNGNTPTYPDRTEWSERKTADYATQTADNVAGSVEKTGVAWEYMIMLANQTSSDIWVNVPMSASDDYITKLAQLLRDGNSFTGPLNPGLNIYVELSNEIWNGIFPSRSYQIAWARALGIDEFDLPAKRTVEISNIFKGVFGASAINSRVRVIYAAQIANSGTYRVDYINQTYGPPKNFIYAVSGAPYFYAGSVNGTGSVDQILNAMSTNIDGEARTWKQSLIGLAKQWGVKAISYEGGPDNGGGSDQNLANRIAANRDPRIKDLMVRDVTTQWWNLGGDMFMHYKLFSGYDKHGMWGLSERHNDLTSVKWQAVDQILGSSPAPTSTPVSPTNTPVSSTNTPVPTSTPHNPTATPTGGLSVTKVRFFPRSGYASRMVGGKFQGSNTSSTSGYVDLATISTAPTDNAWSELTVNTTTSYRYLRYLSPNGGYGNIAEIEFYNGSTKLTGAGFGTAGAWNNGTATFDKALDGSTTTFFDAPTGDGAYVGIDRGGTSPTSTPVPTNTPTSAPVQTPTPTTAPPTGTNKLANPGLESGNTAWNGVAGSWSILQPGSGNTNTGTWAFKATSTQQYGSGTGPSQTITNVPTNTNYVARFWLKGTGKVKMVVNNSSWGYISGAQCTPTSTWTQCSVSFNTGSNTSLIIQMQDHAAGTAYVDDLYVGTP